MDFLLVLYANWGEVRVKLTWKKSSLVFFLHLLIHYNVVSAYYDEWNDLYQKILEYAVHV